jgi:hypothetical protein
VGPVDDYVPRVYLDHLKNGRRSNRVETRGGARVSGSSGTRWNGCESYYVNTRTIFEVPRETAPESFHLHSSRHPFRRQNTSIDYFF